MTLTVHQSGVAACMLDGMCDKEIAYVMGCSRTTVWECIRAMCGLLGARNRNELLIRLAVAAHRGWL